MDEISMGRIAGAFPLAAPPSILLGSIALSQLGSKSKGAFLFLAQGFSVAGFLTLASQPSRRWLALALVAISAGSAPSLSCVPPDWIMKWAGPRAGLFAGLQDVPGNILTMMIYSQ